MDPPRTPGCEKNENDGEKSDLHYPAIPKDNTKIDRITTNVISNIESNNGRTVFQQEWARRWGIPDDLSPYQGPDHPPKTGELLEPSHEKIRENRTIHEGTLIDALECLKSGDILGIGHWYRYDMPGDGIPGFLETVLDFLRKMGKKGIILSTALIYDDGQDVVWKAIQDGTLASIECGGVYGPLAKRISQGELLPYCGVLRFLGYGGRSVRFAQNDPSLRPKVFLAPVSSADRHGRTSGVIGDAKAFCGTSPGFTFLDGRHAEKYVIVADIVYDTFLSGDGTLPGGTFDAFAPEMIIDARKNGIPISNNGIEYGTTKAKQENSSLVAMGTNAANAIAELLRDKSIQFGAGAAIAAFTPMIEIFLSQKDIILKSIVGGHTSATLNIFEKGLARKLLDAQCFITSDPRLFYLIRERRICPTNTWELLSSFNDDHQYQRQDVALLGATTVSHEGVNFMTDSMGTLMTGQGGAMDSATSLSTIYTVPLVRISRDGKIYPGVVHELSDICVPSHNVTAVVTDEPNLIAINPNSRSPYKVMITESAIEKGMKVVTLTELADIALIKAKQIESETRQPIILPKNKHDGEIVAINYARNGEDVMGVFRTS